MDPDETHKQMVAAAMKRIDQGEDLENDEVFDLSCDLAEAVLALDEWLAKGGALPEAWARLT